MKVAGYETKMILMNQVKKIYQILANSLSILAMVTVPVSLCSQENLPAEQVQVLKNFDAQLTEVKKIQIFPLLPEIDTTPRNLQITPRDFTVDLPVHHRALSGLQFSTEPLGESYKGYVSLAAGFPGRLDFKGAYGIERKGDYSILAYLGHEEAGSDFIPFQQWSQQQAGVGGSFVLNPEWEVLYHAAYDRQTNYLFGHAEVDSLNAAALRRRVNQYDLGMETRYLPESGNQSFITKINFGHLLDSYATTENQFKLNTSYRNSFGQGHSAGIELDIDLSYLRDTIERTLNNFLLKPYYSYSISKLSVLAGLNVFNHRDEFSFYPDISFAYALFGSQWQLEAGWIGQLEKNGFHQLYNINPFIQPRLDSIGNSIVNDLYIGLKGKRRNLEYRFRAGYQSIKDWSLFQNIYTPTENGFFRVVYDDVKYPYLQFFIRWTHSPSFTMDAYWNASFYSTDAEAKAWHRPTLQSYIKVNWSPDDAKWDLSLMGWIEGGISYLNEDGQARTLSPIMDLSLEGGYAFSETFNGFLQLRNLPGKRWSRWYNYPSFSTNILVGIKYLIR